MTSQLLMGLILSTAMGGLGYWRKSLTLSGWLGAILVGTPIFGLGGWIWGLLLITFFVSSSWLSHFRQADKEKVAEKFAKGNRRDIGQALANGGLGAVIAIAFHQVPDPLLFAAFLGVMATVNADTWATELGVLSRQLPRRITTGEAVPPGTSGGVTSLGLWASVAGALLIGSAAALFTISGPGSYGWLPSQLKSLTLPLIATAGGLVGSLFDSVLGATVQGVYYCPRCAKETESPVHRCGQPCRPLRGWMWLNNDVVNFLASLLGGLVAASLAWLLWR